MIKPLKGLVKIGVLLCFTLGAFAVSFAALDRAASWPLVTVESQLFPAKDATQLTPYALPFGVGSDTGEAPKPSRPDSKDVRLGHILVVAPIGGLGKPPVHTAKVSLQIFELVLLL